MALAPPSTRKNSHITPTLPSVQNICDLYLSRYLQDKSVRKVLLDAGLIDTHGRVIDVHKFTPKSFMAEFQKILSVSSGKKGGVKRAGDPLDFNTPYNTPLQRPIYSKLSKEEGSLPKLPTQEEAPAAAPPAAAPAPGAARAKGATKVSSGRKKSTASLSQEGSIAPHPPSDDAANRKSHEGAPGAENGKRPGRVIRISNKKLVEGSATDLGEAMVSEGRVMKERPKLVDDHYNNFVLGARAPGSLDGVYRSIDTIGTQTSPVKTAGAATNTTKSFEESGDQDVGTEQNSSSVNCKSENANHKSPEAGMASPSKTKKTSKGTGKGRAEASKLYASSSDKQRVLNVVGRIRDLNASELINAFTNVVTAHPQVMATLEWELNVIEDGDRESPAQNPEGEKSEVEKLKTRVLELEEEVNLYEAEKVRALCEKIQLLMAKQNATTAEAGKTNSNGSPLERESGGSENSGNKTENGKKDDEKENQDESGEKQTEEQSTTENEKAPAAADSKNKEEQKPDNFAEHAMTDV